MCMPLADYVDKKIVWQLSSCTILMPQTHHNKKKGSHRIYVWNILVFKKKKGQIKNYFY